MHSGFDKENKRIDIEESEEGTTYFCPLCHHKLVRRMGDVRRHHFAHVKGSGCDTWFSDDGLYQDKWKSLFPVESIEPVIEVGENKHFADVRIQDSILNFRESYAFPKASFTERNAFYHQGSKKVVWVFDAYSTTIEFAHVEDGVEKRTPLNFETTIRRDSLDIDLFFLHGKKVFHDIISEVSEDLEVYLHFNDDLMIKVIKEVFHNNGETCFKAKLMTIETFVKSFGVEFYNQHVFEDFVKQREDEYNHNILATYLDEEEDTDKRDAAKKLLDDFSLQSQQLFLLLYHLDKLPSQTAPYFIPNPEFKLLDDYLFTRIEKEMKRKEISRLVEIKKKKEEQMRREEENSRQEERNKPSSLTKSFEDYKPEIPMMKPDVTPKLSGWFEKKLELDFTRDNLSSNPNIDTQGVFRHVLGFRYQIRRVSLVEAKRMVKDPDLLVEMTHEEKEFQKIIDQKQKFLMREWRQEKDNEGLTFFEIDLFGHDLKVYLNANDHLYYPCLPDQDKLMEHKLEKKIVSCQSLVQAAKILFDVTYEMDNGDEKVTLVSALQIDLPTE